MSAGALLAFLLAAPVSLAAEPPLHSYLIDARLDAGTHRVYARERLRFVNHSSASLTELHWQLYLNAFRSGHSQYARSTVGRELLRSLAQEGSLEMLSMRAGGTELWDPAYAAADDQTLAIVQLKRPLPPGQALDIDITFIAQLPSLVQRTGFADDFHLVAQWYPKPAKLENDGTFAGAVFHPLAEFYADFADFDITLDVPAEMVVGATGKRQHQQTVGERSQLRFAAHRVHDFAWVAWPRFAQTGGAIAGVSFQVLFPPGHEHNARATVRTLRQALPYFEDRYGRYPYETLTVVHPPEWASEAGGMEYPTFFTTGGAWWDSYVNHEVETVTAHELAHQWFYGLLASNEWRYPFLDEGLASFAESSYLMAQGLQEELFGATTSALGAERRNYGVNTRTKLAAPASSFESSDALAVIAYQRPSLLFHTLSRTFGPAKFDRALLRYAERFRFGHPTPSDLADALASTLPPQARELFDSVALGDGFVDYKVESLGPSSRQAQGYSTGVTLAREGTVSMPLTVEFVDDAGRKTQLIWAGDAPRHAFEVPTRSPLMSVTIDPEHAALLDDNLLNNSLTREAVLPARSYFSLSFIAGSLLALLAP